ncbi:hypothetical protein GCM10023310_70010 [Paenibacillus vulneris]|uniref:Phage protein n=1 Tax=Paenibacillus vulneris TaxID=1133364 RepID=A0ABW3UI80_9BACL
MFQLSDFRPPVINLITNELEVISFAEIEKITKDSKNNTIYHIKDKKYMLITSLDDHNEYLFHLGLRQTDNSNVVNMHKADSYDGVLKNIYFDKKKTRFASVAAVQSKYVKHTVDGLKENKRLEQLDVQYLDEEKTKDKKIKKFLDFFSRKVHNT